MLKVIKAGFYTTIQDAGRFGYRNKGVPISGVMDNEAYNKVNGLLENPLSTPILEITMMGPELVFTQPTFICLGGADLSAQLNKVSITNYKIYKVNDGDTLRFGKLNSGLRCYLGVKNGFNTEIVLNSASQYAPLTMAVKLEKGDVLNYGAINSFQPKISELKAKENYAKETLLVDRGPEFDLLNDYQLAQLFSKQFTIAKENNRMAYQLHELLVGHNTSILTAATQPGTVQFTPAGRLIILMKDGQTTGGYPRILQLRPEAIALLAQKKHQDKLQFKLADTVF